MVKLKEQFVLLTGSDVGNRERHLSEAKRLISERIGGILNISSICETAAWGFESDVLFLNQALLIETTLEPMKLLDIIQEIEIQIGRIKRHQQWTSRIIDIDILCGKDTLYMAERLSIPHKWLHRRVFALKPLCELAPNWEHPLYKCSFSELLSRLILEEKSEKEIV